MAAPSRPAALPSTSNGSTCRKLQDSATPDPGVLHAHALPRPPRRSPPQPLHRRARRAPAGDAEGGGHRRGRGGACKEDAVKLCPELKGKKKADCLRSHEAELSVDCKADLDRKALKKQLHTDCKADVEKFCADIPRGKDNVESCLVGQKAALAPACKAVIEKVVADFKSRPARKGGGKRGHRGGEE